LISILLYGLLVTIRVDDLFLLEMWTHYLSKFVLVLFPQKIFGKLGRLNHLISHLICCQAGLPEYFLLNGYQYYIGVATFLGQF